MDLKSIKAATGYECGTSWEVQRNTEKQVLKVQLLTYANGILNTFFKETVSALKIKVTGQLSLRVTDGPTIMQTTFSD